MRKGRSLEKNNFLGLFYGTVLIGALKIVLQGVVPRGFTVVSGYGSDYR